MKIVHSITPLLVGVREVGVRVGVRGVTFMVNHSPSP